MITPKLVERIERDVNREIEASTPARDVLASLAGESLAVEALGLSVTLRLHSDAERLRFELGAGPASATLRAAPLDLLRLLRSPDLRALQGTSAVLEGSTDVAERFAELFRLARPDLEERLSAWIGDLPAHALAGAARSALGWLRHAGSALTRDAADFLQEERRALPAPLEAQAFYADVERLRDDVERAAARLELAERAARR